MQTTEIEVLLAKVGGVVINDHFVYTSGKHGPAYINKDAIYPHTHETSLLCRALAERFIHDGVQVVVAPAVGAIILAQWTAHHLSLLTGREVLAVYADKDGENFAIKRGYEKLIPGRCVLVVEDLFTTGGSVKKVVEVVRSIGGEVVGVGGLANRGGVKSEEIGSPSKFIALLNVKMVMYEEAACPLCKARVPINTTLGHGREFLKRQKSSNA